MIAQTFDLSRKLQRPRKRRSRFAGFDAFAGAAAAWLARPAAFALALASVLAWGAAGPWCHWPNAWLLVGNTGMSIVSYLVLFLILGDSARGNAALHAKLDEVIVAIPDARNDLVGAEAMLADEIATLRQSGNLPLHPN